MRNVVTIHRDVFEVLEGVTVRYGGHEVLDYRSLLQFVAQELEGSLPGNDYEFEWAPVSRARAARVFEQHREHVAELFDADECLVPSEGNGFSQAALENIKETGIDPADDVARVRAGLSPDALLAECLEGADEDRVEGWREYVERIAEEALQP